MSGTRTADAFDRLPWLADEPGRPAGGGTSGLVLWVLAAILLVAGASYWLGVNSGQVPADRSQRQAQPSTTVALPESWPSPQPEVQPDRVPEVEPAIVPTVRP